MKKGGKMPPRIDGDGGIRTHVPVKAKRFRVVLVMTTSIRLRTSLSKSYLYICITFLSFCQCFYSEIGAFFEQRQKLAFGKAFCLGFIFPDCKIGDSCLFCNIPVW